MLEINHLKMLQSLVRFKTMSEAAKHLCITQPALSNRLREAEKRLGSALFTKTGRRLTITPQGERLLHSAQRVLDELDRAESDIAAMAKGIDQVIRLGVPSYVGYKGWLSSAILKLQTNFPRYGVEITSNPNKETLTELFEGTVNVALTTASISDIEKDASYGHIPLFKDELVAVLPNTHAYANKLFLEADDFKQVCYITNYAVPQKNREYDLYFVPEQILPKQVIQAGPNEAILELVSNGLGVTIMSRWIMQSYLHHTALVAIALGQSGLYVDWCVAFRKEKKLFDPVSVLAETLLEESHG
jgi:LysR family transcriptional regulator, regulator for metE and metH